MQAIHNRASFPTGSGSARTHDFVLPRQTVLLSRCLRLKAFGIDGRVRSISCASNCSVTSAIRAIILHLVVGLLRVKNEALGSLPLQHEENCSS
jgi:hypothetical protein